MRPAGCAACCGRRSSGTDKVQVLHLDMYHCGLSAPQRVPAGFRFQATKPTSSGS